MANDWTKDDVILNNGIFLADVERKVAEVGNLESKLRNTRIFFDYVSRSI